MTEQAPAARPRRSVAERGRRTQAERTALSDQRMFEAAICLIIDRGTQGTTLKDIGELAGYSRGLASHRFGSKEGLMLELFARFDARWKDHLNGYVGDAVGVCAFRAASRALRDFLKLESDYLRAMYILWYESLGRASEIRRRLAHVAASFRAPRARRPAQQLRTRSERCRRPLHLVQGRHQEGPRVFMAKESPGSAVTGRLFRRAQNHMPRPR